MKKLRYAILGATGMVGREFAKILSNHPWIEVVVVAASEKSVGMLYKDRVSGLEQDISDDILNLTIENIYDIKNIAEKVDFVFSAFNLPEKDTLLLEEAYAKNEVVVVSNNSAARFVNDVPMIVPEINGVEHLHIIPYQKQRLGTTNGFIVVKTNCAAQAYIAIIDAIIRDENNITFLSVSLKQAISGSGKYLKDVPEIQGNILALPGETHKSVVEPKKIFGLVKDGVIKNNDSLKIIADSYRVPVEHGHTASIVFGLEFKESLLNIIKSFNTYSPLRYFYLPSSPSPVINYLGDRVFPNPIEHVNNQNGMEFTCGGLSYDESTNLYQITGLIHNLVRGAAGGAILTAELLIAKRMIKRKV